MHPESPLDTLYETLWRDALAGFAQGRFELDPHIDDPADTRRGLSLIVRPGGAALDRIGALRDELAEIATGQYLPALAEMHVTVLSIVSCEAGFAPDDDEAGRYADAVGACLGDLPAFDLRFRGMTASPSCLMVRGFPCDDALASVRDSVRRTLANSDLRCTVDARYPARTAHVTLLRFRRPPAAPDALVRALLPLHDRPFGTCRADTLELVLNDWYHRAADVRTVRRFALG